MVSQEEEASGEDLGWIFWGLCWWEGRSDVGTVLDVFKNKWMWCLGSRVRSGLGSAGGELMINDLRSFSNLNESIIHQKQFLHVVIQLSELSTSGHSWCNSGLGGAAEPQI